MGKPFPFFFPFNTRTHNEAGDLRFYFPVSSCIRLTSGYVKLGCLAALTLNITLFNDLFSAVIKEPLSSLIIL